MINKYNGGKINYIGMIRIKLSYGGCNDMNVYTSNDKELYDQLDDIDYMHRYNSDPKNYGEYGSCHVIGAEEDNDNYYFFDEVIPGKHARYTISIFLKKPVTAATYIKFIKYFDNATSSNFREFLNRTCNALVRLLKVNDFISTPLDYRMMINFNDGNDDGVVDYENKFNISPAELQDLFGDDYD